MKSHLITVLIIFSSLSLYSQYSTFELINGDTINARVYDQDSLRFYVYNKASKGEVFFVYKDSVLNIITGESLSLPLDVSFGFGSSHGFLGVKTVIGKNNSGVFVGLGGTPHGLISPSIGIQGALNVFFGNVGYGSRGFYQFRNESYQLDMDIFYNIGFLFRFGEHKDYFVELAFGGIGINKKFDPGNRAFEYFNYNGTIAIGVSL